MKWDMKRLTSLIMTISAKKLILKTEHNRIWKLQQPIYAFGPFRTDLDNWVRISKGGKDNPIVFWRINNPKYTNLDILMYAVYMVSLNASKVQFDNFDDFKEYLEENSYF